MFVSSKSFEEGFYTWKWIFICVAFTPQHRELPLRTLDKMWRCHPNLRINLGWHPQDIQLRRSSANCFIAASSCISLVPHSKETEGDGTERNSFPESVGDYGVWYLRQQEVGPSSPVLLSSRSLAVLTGFSTHGSVSSFNQDLHLATKEENPEHALASAFFSSCWEKLYISCAFYGMGNFPT